MNSKYIDIHSHLNLPAFDEDREEIIQKLKDDNIWTITIGADYKSSLFAVELALKNYNLFASVGLHPVDSVGEKFDHDQMLSLASNSKVVSIGECGLDYFYNDDKEIKLKQKEVFESHIKLAIEVNKPLMIHARPSGKSMDAYIDVLDILEVYKKENPNLHANFHFFSGDIDIAKKVVQMGFSLSFDGPITFSNDYNEVIKIIPIEFIMAETDSPFAAPIPYRGKRCEPQMVKEIIKKIAEIKGLSEEEALNIMNNNAKRIFDI